MLKSDRFGMEIKYNPKNPLDVGMPVKIRPFRYGNLTRKHITINHQLLLKSDRFGMEIWSIFSFNIFIVMLKSDRFGMEINILHRRKAMSKQLKSDRFGMEIIEEEGIVWDTQKMF